MLFTLNEIPTKLDVVVWFFVKSIVCHSEERTLDSSHEGASSSYWLTWVKCSGWFHIEMIFDKLNEGRYSRSSSHKFDAVKIDFFLCNDIFHFIETFYNCVEDRLTQFFELLSLHIVMKIVFFHEILDIKIVFNITR